MTAVLPLVCTLLASCAVSPLPPRLTTAQATRLHELPLNRTVGVERHANDVYSRKLEEALTASRVFKQVAPLESFSKAPDLVARVERQVHGAATIPAATFLTVGLVPTIVDEEHGFVFSLAPASRKTNRTVIDASYRGPTILGWAALPAAGSPDSTLSDPEKTERFRAMIAYRTLEALRPSRKSGAAR